MRAVVALARLIAALTPVLIGGSYALRLDAPGPLWGPGAVVGAVFPAVGAFLLTYRPRLRVGWLIWGGGTAVAVYEVLRQVASWLYAADHQNTAATLGWVYAWLGPFGMYLLLAAAFLYPDGHPPSPRWRPLVVAATCLPLAWDLLGEPRDVGEPLRAHGWPIPVAFALAALVLRYRHGSADIRRQILWFGYPGSVLVVLELSAPQTPPFRALHAVVLLVLPVATAVGIMRYRLSDIDLIINRTLVFGVLVSLIGAGYFGLSGAIGMLGDGWAPLVGLIGAFAAGALLSPLRDRLQQAADRLLCVERDPYRLADQLSRTVQEAPGPAAALVTAIATVRETLRVPGAAVEIIRSPGDIEVYSRGPLGEDPYTVPLIWHGERVGRMLVARPQTGRIDTRLLGMLAVHLADVAHAVRLTAQLQRSRATILAAREEERRRLRRDLHDGLGPTLASLAMSLDAARLTLARDPARAPVGVEPLLAELRDRMAGTIGDIRDLVDGLRPPALDDLGLEGAIRSLAEGSCQQVDVRFHGDPADLPAAVEVAAYRIVQEALTNVRRHAQAPTALVLLNRDTELHITVVDSGVGVPVGTRPGAGLTSMRERAAELGGVCTVAPRSTGGTIVSARLPLAGPSPPQSAPPEPATHGPATNGRRVSP